jgi:hypothetical protein
MVPEDEPLHPHRSEAPTQVARCGVMDIEEFWDFIEQARTRAADSADAEDIAHEATVLLATQEPEQIVSTEQILSELMAVSYQAPLWAAAYVINGGCSDDGFDYFRGWLITQGRTAFERVVADPDHLADLPAVRAAVAAGIDLECESMLYIASNAYRTASGQELPSDFFTVSYPDLDPAWNFSFEDHNRIAARLPRTVALYDE